MSEINQYMQIEKDFYEKYTNQIVPLVQKYETDRKKNLSRAIITSSILCLLASVVLIFVIIHGGIFDHNNRWLSKISILIYWFSWLSWFGIKKDFENSIKEKIMPTVCSCFGDLKWYHDNYCEAGIFSTSGAIPRFTSQEYDDIFKGSYKDVNIDIVESEFMVGSGKDKSTVFDGVIVKLDMNKHFSSHTVIKPKNIIKLPPFSNLHHTELEDVEFNKRFEVFTNDEVDARYLITPSFMERLKNVETAFGADKISCAFYRKHLIIALPTGKDLFSICSLVKPIDDKEQYFQMFKEIFSIIRLIDYFKLNQKIGL